MLGMGPRTLAVGALAAWAASFLFRKRVRWKAFRTRGYEEPVDPWLLELSRIVDRALLGVPCERVANGPSGEVVANVPPRPWHTPAPSILVIGVGLLDRLGAGDLGADAHDRIRPVTGLLEALLELRRNPVGDLLRGLEDLHLNYTREVAGPAQALVDGRILRGNYELLLGIERRQDGIRRLSLEAFVHEIVDFFHEGVEHNACVDGKEVAAVGAHSLKKVLG